MWLPYNRPPYKWRRRGVIDNVRCIFRQVWQGPINVFRWMPIIWFDQDWDHCFLLDILEYKFKRMSESQEHNQIVTSWPLKARQLKICQVLCARLHEDNYMANAQLAFHTSKDAVIEAVAVQKHDQEYLGRIIGKHLVTWWD